MGKREYPAKPTWVDVPEFHPHVARKYEASAPHAPSVAPTIEAAQGVWSWPVRRHARDSCDGADAARCYQCRPDPVGNETLISHAAKPAGSKPANGRTSDAENFLKGGHDNVPIRVQNTTGSALAIFRTFGLAARHPTLAHAVMAPPIC